MELLGTKAISDKLGISMEAIRKAANAGHFQPYAKVGHRYVINVAAQDFKDWLTNRPVNTPGPLPTKRVRKAINNE